MWLPQRLVGCARESQRCLSHPANNIDLQASLLPDRFNKPVAIAGLPNGLGRHHKNLLRLVLLRQRPVVPQHRDGIVAFLLRDLPARGDTLPNTHQLYLIRENIERLSSSTSNHNMDGIAANI